MLLNINLELSCMYRTVEILVLVEILLESFIASKCLPTYQHDI